MRVHYPFLHHIQTSTPPLGPHQRTQIQKPGLKFHLSSTWRGPLIFVHFDNQGLGHGLSNHHQSFPMNVEMEREESIQRQQGGKRRSKISSYGPLPNLRKKPYYLNSKHTILMLFKKIVSFLREMNFFELKV